MNKRICGIAAVCILLIGIAGCNKAETEKISAETAEMAIRFDQLVKSGKTTREQEQAYIAAVGKVAYQLDRAIRGTTAADTTQRQAIIEATTGINPNAPVNLDDSKLLQKSK